MGNTFLSKQYLLKSDKNLTKSNLLEKIYLGSFIECKILIKFFKKMEVKMKKWMRGIKGRMGMTIGIFIIGILISLLFLSYEMKAITTFVPILRAERLINVVAARNAEIAFKDYLLTGSKKAKEDFFKAYNVAVGAGIWGKLLEKDVDPSEIVKEYRETWLHTMHLPGYEEYKREIFPRDEKEVENIVLIGCKLKKIKSVRKLLEIAYSHGEKVKELGETVKEYFKINESSLEPAIKEKELASLRFKIEKLFDEVYAKGSEFSQSAAEVAYWITNVINVLLILTTIFFITFGSIVAFFLSRAIIRPLPKLTNISKRIAQGDLTVSCEVERSTEELEILMSSTKEMIENLRQIVHNIRTAADKVNISSQSLSSSTQEVNASIAEISGVIQQISKGMSIQSDKVENIKRLIEEMVGAVKEVVENVQSSAKDSEIAVNIAQKGEKMIERVVERMSKIFSTVKNSSETIQALAERSQQISEITTTITKIADQTNLLALNAAIEAARAGEAGHGFAVVAEEIRKLAEGSARASNQIDVLIRGIQGEIEKAVISMEEGTKDVEEGRETVTFAKNTFNTIVNTVQKVVPITKKGLELTDKQLKITEKVVKAMDEIANIAQQSASSTQQVSSSIEEQSASMQEIASSASELAHMATDLKESVAKFRL